MSRVLVTGGAGFIGSHVVEALSRAGRPVTILDDFSTGRRENLRDLEAVGAEFDLVEGSIADAAAVERAMRDVTGVVHLAALPSVARSVERPLDTHHACATGTITVLHAAALQKARVVYAGSSSAYGNQQAKFKQEDLREDPLSPYSASKLAGELYCRAFARVYDLRVVVTRFFNVFGPRQPADSPYSGVVAAFCRALLRGEAPRVDGDGLQSRDFTYVEDVVDGVLRCLDGETRGCVTVNLAYGQATTVMALYEQLTAHARELLGRDDLPAPKHAPPRAGDVRHSLADTARARETFGFEPRVGFADGLKRTFEWYRTGSGRSAQ
ncbi:MAG: NAD-dependent epimerase/dehydratase family protein [Planctomycetes bacterium]|nr:NAD-dependent epimerase/dehydratase family protein [Planctomycetota bacterium]